MTDLSADHLDDDHDHVEDPVRSPYRMWRWLAYGGGVYLTLLIAGWAMIAGFLPPPPQAWDAQQVHAFFLEDNAMKRAGMLLFMLGAPLYVTFCLVISRLLKRIEGPRGILYQVELAGGVASVALGEVSSLLWLTAAYRTDDRTPEITQLLNDMAWFSFDLWFMVPVLQMLAIGIVVAGDRSSRPLFPRWLAWASFGLAASQFPLVLLPFVEDGPFAWDGLINFWVVLNCFFWWVVLMIVMTVRAVGELERQESDALAG